MDPQKIGFNPLSIEANLKYYLNLEKPLDAKFPYLILKDGLLSTGSREGYLDPVKEDARQVRLFRHIIIYVKDIKKLTPILLEIVEKIAAIFHAQIQPLVNGDIHKKNFHIQIFTALLEFHMRSHLNTDLIDVKKTKRASASARKHVFTLSAPESSSESSSPKRGSPRTPEETQTRIANLSLEGLQFFRIYCLFQFQRTKMDEQWKELITVAEYERIQEVLYRQNTHLVVQAQVSRSITSVLCPDGLAGCINRTLFYVSIYNVENKLICGEKMMHSQTDDGVYLEKQMRFFEIIHHLISEMKYNQNEYIYIKLKLRDAFKKPQEFGPDTFKDQCKNFLSGLSVSKSQDNQLLQALLILSQHTYTIPGMAVKEGITEFPLDQGPIRLCYRFFTDTKIEFESRVVLFPKKPSNFFIKRTLEDSFHLEVRNTLLKDFRETKLWTSNVAICLKLPKTLTKEDIKNSVIKPLKGLGFIPIIEDLVLTLD